MTRTRSVALLIAILGALVLRGGLPNRASAQTRAPMIEVTAAFDVLSASIGDRVMLTVTLTHPEDVVVRITPPNVQYVDLISAAPATIQARPDGRRTTTIVYNLQPFILGTLDTGTLRVSWLRADGSTGALDAPGAQLIIAPVRAPNDEALRPLKPQLSVEGAPPAWIRPTLTAIAVLVLGAIALFVARLLSRRRQPAPVEALPVGSNSPEQAARRGLDALAVHNAGHIDYPAYYGGIALTVRSYLAARFGFNAHALTTTELEQRMISHGVDRWQARLVGGLLERCDDAVYARRYPDPASADHDLTVAYEIVELSRPNTLAEGRTALA